MKKENMFLFYLLSFTWGAIYTFIGLLVLLVIRLFFNRLIEEYRIVAGRIAIITKKALSGAFELGIVYVIDKDCMELYELHAHEIGHSIQNAWFGPFFIILAIVGVIRFHLWDWLSERHYKKHGEYLDYYGVWFEAQATELGNKYCLEKIKRDLKK